MARINIKRKIIKISHMAVNPTIFKASFVFFLSQNIKNGWARAMRAQIMAEMTNIARKRIGPRRLFILPKI